ncbi:hypothetical protein MKEN_00314400 [Mycena kentingensis (nom. inval.)]|nr:hypothetical protein MKEN_00314400 [Mycena kentingensis (nom. inval.)]
MSKHVPLSITVVEPLDWPPLQDFRINTPGSLFPRSVRDGDDTLSILTPNGSSGWWPATGSQPSTANTFGFALSPRSPNFSLRRRSTHLLPPPKTPLERQKRRLRRYNTAETRLARLPDPAVLSPPQLHIAALKFAVRAVAGHVFDAQQLLRDAVRQDRRDGARWMAEQQVASLELLQDSLRIQLKQGSTVESPTEDRAESNLVRFLGSASVVPVFTKRIRRTPPPNRLARPASAEKRRMATGSPMLLQADSSSTSPQTPRSEWSWETRIRAVLLYPHPKPPQHSPPPSSDLPEAFSRSTTETPTSSYWVTTPTSESFSPFEEHPEPHTPLTDLGNISEEEEQEDDDVFEDYPTFHRDSALSYIHAGRPPPPPLNNRVKAPPAPRPLSTNLRPDTTYGWLADPSSWASPTAWHGDGWEVSSHSRTSSLAFEPISASTASTTSAYPYGFASAGYINSSSSPLSAAMGTRDRSLTMPGQPQPSSTSTQSRSSFWGSIPGRHRRMQSLKPASATEGTSYTPKPLPQPPLTPQSAPIYGPSTPGPRKEKEKGFFAGLVRKATLSSSHSRSQSRGGADAYFPDAEPSPSSDTSSVFSFGMGQNKLRKRPSGLSLRRMGSERSLHTAMTPSVNRGEWVVMNHHHLRHRTASNRSTMSLDKVTGALLIGTWASSLLYTAEFTQTLYYFRNFKNDSWKLKTMVAAGFIIDTTALLNDYASVYLYAVTHVGDAEYFQNQNWTIPVYVVSTAVVAMLVQSFLVMRYWKFTHKHLTTLVLVLFMLGGFGGSITCGLMVALFPAFKDRGKLKIPAILWLVTEAAADLAIAAALLWEFVHVRPAMRDTRNALDRLVSTTIQTGAATATLALAALLGYLLDEESNVPVGIAFCLGRTYMLSMLVNLNIRRTARSTPSSKISSPSTVPPPSTVAFARYGTTAGDVGTGIHVHRTAIVHIEGQDSNQDQELRSGAESESLHYKTVLEDQPDKTDAEIEMLARGRGV